MKYVGIDYHKKYSYATALDPDGGELVQQKLPNTEEAFRRFLGDGADVKAVMEAGRCWGWLYDLLDEVCAEAKLAHPLKVKAIASAKIKNDKIDSRVLAELLSADLIPEAYARPIENRRSLAALRQRAFWVAGRTRVKNRIHQLADRQGSAFAQTIPSCSDLFGKVGMEFLRAAPLPASERELLDALLAGIDFFNGRIKESDRQVSAFYKSDPVARRLSTIPGIGEFFSVMIRQEIDRIDRFPTPEKLHSYAGLVPSTYASGGKVRHGRLTKQGSPWLRWAAVEAAIPAQRSDWQLRALYEQHKKRKGTKQAKIVVARRLLTLVHRLWAQDRDYDPARLPQRLEKKMRNESPSRGHNAA